MSDYMIRATAANGQIRAFAATTRTFMQTPVKKKHKLPYSKDKNTSKQTLMHKH